MSFGAFRPFGLFAPFRANPIAAGIASLFTPAVLFENNEQGLWYDPSDFSTMFQDSVGTTPVTAVGQPVGLILDKRLGLVRGAELLAGFVITSAGTPPAPATYNTSTGQATFARTDAANLSYITLTGLNINTRYEITVQNTGSLSLSIRTNDRATALTGVNPGATVTARVSPAGAANLALVPDATGSASCTVVSVRELPGNHASQATAASRPVLSARVNQLTRTEEFDNAFWTKGSSGIGSAPIVTANAALSPIGTMTADLIVFNLNGGTTINDFSLLASSSNTITGASYIFRVYLKTADGSTKNIGINFSGEPPDSGSNGASHFVVVTGEWKQFFIVDNSATDNVRFPRIFLRGTQGTANSANLHVWGADFRFLNMDQRLPSYQRVTTASDYDSSGFPHYLLFDGVDDWLQTAAIDFTATDKVNVFAGIRKLSDAAAGIVVELSADINANNGAFNLIAPQATATANYGFRSRGTIAVDATSAATFAAPITGILTGIGDISGDLARLRVNGAVAATSTADQGTGNFGNYPLYIGRRAGTTLPFNGHLYQFVIRGALSTDDRIRQTEEFIGDKTGVEV